MDGWVKKKGFLCVASFGKAFRGWHACQILRNLSQSCDPPSLAYVDRVNRAIDFVLRHLDEPLRLEAVAHAACFSPYHFHRVFRLVVGEPLGEFVKRLRLERALTLMAQKGWSARRQPSLTDIAFACGFASSSDFTRCFKAHFGVAPSRFDLRAHREARREQWKQEHADPARPHLLAGLPPGVNPDGFEVRRRHLPARQVAYLRVPRPFRPGVVQRAAERLVGWAEARGLADGQWLGYMWDDPDLTAHEHCRYDVGVEVVAPFVPAGEVSRHTFPAMQVAEVEIQGGIDLELRALDWIYGTWLPASGFVPAEHPCFEAWVGRPFAHGAEHFELRVQLPVARG